jgi:hypothetical protein
MSQDDRAGPRRPVAEPEILPPEAPHRQARGAEQMFVRQRIYIARPGAVAMTLAMLALAALGLAGGVLFVGLALFLLPVAALAVGALIIAALLRGPRRY